MSQVSISFERLWFWLLPIALSNFFYFSPIFNYKVLAILGLPLALRMIRIEGVLIGMALFAMQALLLAKYSAYYQDSMIYMTLTLGMAIGYFSWMVIWLRQPTRPPLWLYVVALLVDQVVPNTVLSLDPLQLSGFFFLGYLSKGRINIPYYRAMVFFVVAIVASILSGWRAAEVALLVGVLAYTTQRHRSPLVKNTLMLLASISVLLIAYLYQQELLTFLISSGTGGDPSSGRIAMFAYVQRFLFDNFQNGEIGSLIGFGFNSFSQIFTDDVTAFFSLNGQEIISTKKVKFVGNSRLHAHNAIIQVTMEFGIVGLGIYLWSIVKFWKATRPLQFLVLIGIVGGQFSAVFYPYSPYYLMLLAFMWLKAKRSF